MVVNRCTAVTRITVALANVRIKRNFRRSFTAALMHDLFNIFTVALFFPLEWITGALHESGRGILTRLAALLADTIGLERSEERRVGTEGEFGWLQAGCS